MEVAGGADLLGSLIASLIEHRRRARRRRRRSPCAASPGRWCRSGSAPARGPTGTRPRSRPSWLVSRYARAPLCASARASGVRRSKTRATNVGVVTLGCEGGRAAAGGADPVAVAAGARRAAAGVATPTRVRSPICLRHAVFEQLEVRARQIGDRPSPAVAHDDVDHHRRRRGAEFLRFLPRLADKRRNHQRDAEHPGLQTYVHGPVPPRRWHAAV